MQLELLFCAEPGVAGQITNNPGLVEDVTLMKTQQLRESGLVEAALPVTPANT
jgi:predicted transglutaminase-like cysteine proteinase